ncbi:adenine phosphoribosyltransferase [Yaniella flava]|uniref:Adenine phosphoribosyltransferase n=1 Tax=Yaniella flava TaxID=287930 RepID=A0ABN2U610_9MICC
MITFPSDADSIAYARSLIRTIADYPKPGVQFRDITPLLADGQAMQTVAEALISQANSEFDVVAGVEARGFIFAGAAAAVCGRGMVPIRKQGKLPMPAHRLAYDKEYGHDALEVSPELEAGMRVLLIDDILATGGTLKAGAELMRLAGAELASIGVVMELQGLGGRTVVPETKALFSL